MTDIGVVRGFLELVDQWTPVLKQAELGLAQFSDKAEKFGRSATQAGAALTTSLTLPIVAVGAAAIKMSTDLNTTIANVSALLTTVSGKELEGVTTDMKEGVRELAVEMGKSTGDISGGLYEVVSSLGYTADSFEQLETSAKAGAAGLATTQESFKFLSAVTKTYGDTSAEAFTKVADLGFQAVNFGQTTFPELAASIGNVAPIAQATGVAMEEMFAVIATATGVTGETTEVTTQMASAINGLLTPGKELQAMYDQLGIESGEALIAEKGLVGALQEVAKYSEESGDAITTLLGRKEAFILTAYLAGEGADDFAVNLDRMGQAAKANGLVVDDAFKKQTTGVGEAAFAWKQFKAEMQVTAEKLGDTLVPILLKAADALRPLFDLVLKAVEAFAKWPTPMQTVVVAIAAMAAALGPLLIVVGQVALGVSALTGLLGGGALTGALGGATVAAKSLTGVLGGPAGLLVLLTAVLALNEAIKKWGIDTSQAMARIVKEGNNLGTVLDGLRAKGKAVSDEAWKRQTEALAGLQATAKLAREEFERLDAKVKAAIANGGTTPFDLRKLDEARDALFVANQAVETHQQAWAGVKRESDEATTAIVTGTEAAGKGVKALTEEELAALEEMQKRVAASSLTLSQTLAREYSEGFRGIEFAATDLGIALEMGFQSLEEVPARMRPVIEMLQQVRLEMEAQQFAMEHMVPPPDFFKDYGAGGGPSYWKTQKEQLDEYVATAQAAYVEDYYQPDFFDDFGAGEAPDIWGDLGGRERIREGLEQVAADMFSIWGGAMEGIISGSLKGVDALRAVVQATVQSIGSAVAQAFGSTMGAVGNAAFAAVIPLFGAVIDKFLSNSDAWGESLFKVGEDGLEAKIGRWRTGTWDTLQGINAAVVGVVDGMLEMLGGTLASAEFRIKVEGDDEFTVFINGIEKFFDNVQDAIEFTVTELFRTSEVLGLSVDAANAVKLAAEQAAGDLEAFKLDVDFIVAFDEIGKSAAQLALVDLDTWFKDASERATRLGLDLSKVTAEYERQASVLKGQELLSFGNSLIDFVTQYYGEVAGGEEFRRSLEEINHGLRLAELKVQYLALVAMGAVSAELAAQVDALFAVIDSAPPMLGRDPLEDAADREAEREARREERRRERERMRSEIDQAIDSIAGPMEALRDRFAEIGKTITFLQEKVDAGKLSVERFNEAMAGLALQEYVAFGNSLLGFVDKYYSDIGIGEQLRHDLIEATQIMELAYLRMQFDLLVGLGLLTAAQIDMINGIFLQIDRWNRLQRPTVPRPPGMPDEEEPPAAPPPFVPPSFNTPDIRDTVDQVKALADAIKALAGDNDPIAQVTAKFDALSEQLGELRQWEKNALKGQLSGLMAELGVTSVQALLDALEQMELAELMAEKLRPIEDAIRSMTASSDPLDQIADRFNAMRAELEALSDVELSTLSANLADVMAEMGVSTIEELYAALEQMEIDAVLERQFGPIRDFFDDLRTGGKGLSTTAKYENTLDLFNQAIAAGDHATALGYAKLLTGDLGVSQFGSASDLFENLQQDIVSALGSLLPEGPPEDLLGERTASAAEGVVLGVDDFRREAHLDSEALRREMALVRAELAKLTPLAGARE